MVVFQNVANLFESSHWTEYLSTGSWMLHQHTQLIRVYLPLFIDNLFRHIKQTHVMQQARNANLFDLTMV